MAALATADNLRKVFERVDSSDPYNPTQLTFHNHRKILLCVLSFWKSSDLLRFTMDYMSFMGELDKVSETILDIEIDKDDLHRITDMGGILTDDFCSMVVRIIKKCLTRELCENCGLGFIDDGQPICLRCQLLPPSQQDLRECPICLMESHKRTFIKTSWCCGQDMHKSCYEIWKAIKPECSLCRQLPITHYFSPYN